MLKEIMEQPESLADTVRGRLNLEAGEVVLGGIRDVAKQLTHARRVILVACGTAWHAGLVGEFLFEDLARIPTEVEYASEFRYRNPIIDEGTIVIAISQSGETADTLAAVREAKLKGRWPWASSTSSARPSPARRTPASTCTAGRRSAWPRRRPSPASWRSWS